MYFEKMVLGLTLLGLCGAPLGAAGKEPDEDLGKQRNKNIRLVQSPEGAIVELPVDPSLFRGAPKAESRERVDDSKHGPPLDGSVHKEHSTERKADDPPEDPSVRIFMEFPATETPMFIGPAEGVEQPVADMLVLEGLFMDETVAELMAQELPASESWSRPSGCGALPFSSTVAVGWNDRIDCTGVVVGARRVLTARHCLPVNRVVTGAVVSENTGEYSVVSVQEGPAGKDVALLVLDRAVTGLPIELAADIKSPYGEIGLMGYGSNHADGVLGAGVLRGGRVDVAGWGCDVARARSTGCLPGSEMVIADAAGSDTCDGDSGGPVVVCHRGAWQLLGITSRPVAKARRRCGTGGVYVRADQLTHWISATPGP